MKTLSNTITPYKLIKQKLFVVADCKTFNLDTNYCINLVFRQI